MVKSTPKLIDVPVEKAHVKDYLSDASSVTPLRLKPNRLHADAYQHFQTGQSFGSRPKNWSSIYDKTDHDTKIFQKRSQSINTTKPSGPLGTEEHYIRQVPKTGITKTKRGNHSVKPAERNDNNLPFLSTSKQIESKAYEIQADSKSSRFSEKRKPDSTEVFKNLAKDFLPNRTVQGKKFFESDGVFGVEQNPNQNMFKVPSYPKQNKSIERSKYKHQDLESLASSIKLSQATTRTIAS